jgi:hypothetical protein
MTHRLPLGQSQPVWPTSKCQTDSRQGIRIFSFALKWCENSGMAFGLVLENFGMERQPLAKERDEESGGTRN